MRFLVGLFLVFSLSFVCHFTAMAQPCGTPGLPPCDPGDPVPITGIEILLGAGALLGAKKLRQRISKQ